MRERRLSELAARLREVEAEREALAIIGKTVRTMAADLQLEGPLAPAQPDGAAYQQITDVIQHERRALRARDPYISLDLPVLPKHTEGTRAKLNA